MKAVCQALLMASVAVARLLSQTVEERDGNIYFTDTDGHTVQLTSTGLDSSPSLSKDTRLVVFVRKTPSLKIGTGLGYAIDNELWVAHTSGTEPAQRILIGHPGTFHTDGSLLLAGFRHPQFSPDARRVYFESTAWASAGAVWMGNVETGKATFLYVGSSVEVIQSGQYAGYLIALKEIPRVVAGRVERYWLLDRDGKEVGEIGESNDSLTEFKEAFEVDGKR